MDDAEILHDLGMQTVLGLGHSVHDSGAFGRKFSGVYGMQLQDIGQ